jgi:hypothetical protein
MSGRRAESAFVGANCARDKTDSIDAGSRDCDALLSKLRVQLSNPDDWSVRASALEAALSHLTGGGHPHPTDFSVLAVGVASCVTDLRSALVRAATNFVIACARLLKERYVTSVKVIVPALFKPLTSGTSIIADSCHHALLAIAKSVQHRRTVTVLLPYAQSKSKQHRLIVAESLTLIAEWPECVHSSLARELEGVTAALSDDAAAEVRSAARAAKTAKATPPRRSMIPSPRSGARRTAKAAPRPAENEGTPPVRAPSVVRFVEHVEMPDVSAFAKPKSIMKHRVSRPEAKGVDAFMPPKTMQKAEAFLQFLGESDDEGLRAKLSDRELLTAQSVLAAAEFIPQFEDWESVIPRLFRVFPDIFLDMMHEIWRCFRFDARLFVCACEIFGIESLIEQFTNLQVSLQKGALRFFVLLIQSGQEFTLTDDLQSYLQQLVQNSKERKGVQTIEIYLAKFADPRRVVNDFLERLKGVGDFSEDLAKLRQCRNLPELEPELETELFHLLTVGTGAERWRVISAVASLSELSFRNLRSNLLRLAMRDESPDREMALTCLATLMNASHIFQETLEMVVGGTDEVTEQAVLSVLLRFVSGATQEQLSEVLPIMFGPIAGLLESEIITLRRIALFILVECKMKLGQRFARFLRRISTPHQKLLELYIAKRKK